MHETGEQKKNLGLLYNAVPKMLVLPYCWPRYFVIIDRNRININCPEKSDRPSFSFSHRFLRPRLDDLFYGILLMKIGCSFDSGYSWVQLSDIWRQYFVANVHFSKVVYVFLRDPYTFLFLEFSISRIRSHSSPPLTQTRAIRNWELLKCTFYSVSDEIDHFSENKEMLFKR